MFDAALRMAWLPVKSEWLADLDDRAIDDMLAAVRVDDSPFNQVLLRQMGGATSRVAPGATAFSFRDAAQLLTVVGAWTPGDDPAPQVAWARDLWGGMRRVSSGGAYVNQLDADESTDRVREAYGVPTGLARRAEESPGPDQPVRSTRTCHPASHA